MIRQLKRCVIKCVCAYSAARMRIKGIVMGKGCIIAGTPHIRKERGSRITLGDDVILHSIRRFNPLLQKRLSLITLVPGASIELKSHCAVGGCIIEACSKITIGEYTIIGPGTVIYDAKEHEYDSVFGWRERSARSGRPITIGKRCYIGMNCIILKGVTIGDDCVIGTGSIVKNDVPSGHIIQSAPCVSNLLPEHLRQS